MKKSSVRVSMGPAEGGIASLVIMAKKIPRPKTRGPVKMFSPGSGLSWEDKL